MHTLFPSVCNLFKIHSTFYALSYYLFSLGEASQDVLNLVEVLARARLKFQVLQEGRPDGGSDQELRKR